MFRCPACESSRWHGAPAGYTFEARTTVPQRCEVCEGAGVVTRVQIMDWESSL